MDVNLKSVNAIHQRKRAETNKRESKAELAGEAEMRVAETSDGDLTWDPLGQTIAERVQLRYPQLNLHIKNKTLEQKEQKKKTHLHPSGQSYEAKEHSGSQCQSGVRFDDDLQGQNVRHDTSPLERGVLYSKYPNEHGNITLYNAEIPTVFFCHILSHQGNYPSHV